MDDSPKRSSKLQFTIRTLLFLALCIAGLLAGYRIGHKRGYTDGAQKRISEEPVSVVYDVGDVVSFAVMDNDSGRWRPARGHERTEAVADFDSLIEVITSTIHPGTWEEVGGEGSVTEVEDKLSLVVRQRPYVHEEVQSLLHSLQQKNLAMPEVTETESVDNDGGSAAN